MIATIVLGCKKTSVVSGISVHVVSKTLDLLVCKSVSKPVMINAQ